MWCQLGETGLEIDKLKFPKQRVIYLVFSVCQCEFSHSNRMMNVRKLMSRKRNLLNYS